MNVGTLHPSLTAGAARPGVLRSRAAAAFGAFAMPQAHRHVNVWTTKAAYSVICTDRPIPRPLERSP